MKQILILSLVFLVLVTAACAPASTPVPTLAPAGPISPAVITVDMYYTFINAAQDATELVIPWNMLTLEEQCNPRDKCELLNFQNKWWQSNVLYRLYDCGTDIVTAEEMRYPRGSKPPSEFSGKQFWIYELVDFDGIMLIGDSYLAKEPGEGCVLTLERIANP